MHSTSKPCRVVNRTAGHMMTDVLPFCPVVCVNRREVNKLTFDVAVLGIHDPGKRHQIESITQEVFVRYKEEVLNKGSNAMEYASFQSNLLLSSRHSSHSQSCTSELAQHSREDQPSTPRNRLDDALVQGSDIPSDGSCFIFTTKETWKLPHNATLKAYIKSSVGDMKPTIKVAELVGNFYKHCKRDGKRLYCMQRFEETGKRPIATRKNWHTKMYETLKCSEAYDVLKFPMNTVLEECGWHEKERPLLVQQQKTEKCIWNEIHQEEKTKGHVSSTASQHGPFNLNKDSFVDKQGDVHSSSGNQRNSATYSPTHHFRTLHWIQGCLHELDGFDTGESETVEISDEALMDHHFWDGTCAAKDEVREVPHAVCTSSAAIGR